MFYFPAIIYMPSTKKKKKKIFINSALQLLFCIPYEEEPVQVKGSTHQDSISTQTNHIHIPPN